MRILNTKQIRELDAYTIRQEGIPSIALMERAARAFVDWFTVRIDVTSKTGVVCGTGNNGGDGLAIARMLDEWGYAVKVWIIQGGAAESEDFKINRDNLGDNIVCSVVNSETDPVSFSDYDVLIDAVFGSGLSRPVGGLYARVIELMNASPAMRISVDIPSGLQADGNSSGAIVKAHYTVTFQLPKLAFLLPQSYPYTGEWVTVDIGLNRQFIRDCQTVYRYTGLKDVRKMIKVRARYDHKGTFGHALLIAGSFGKMGAAVLASRAALRCGLGLLTLYVPRCGYSILQTAVPEAMVMVDQEADFFSHPPDHGSYTALGIGPGLGRHEMTALALVKTLERFEKPVVIDADALNLLAADKGLFKAIPPGSILTPHPKEFERLVGQWKDDFERLEKQKGLASALQSIVVLKGAHTSIATADGMVYFNPTGNPGMATGGTGDVLTGVITGLLAQKYSPRDAAIAGVFLHGLAGDLALADYGADSLIASDLIDFLPKAFIKVKQK